MSFRVAEGIVIQKPAQQTIDIAAPSLKSGLEIKVKPSSTLFSGISKICSVTFAEEVSKCLQDHYKGSISSKIIEFFTKNPVLSQIDFISELINIPNINFFYTDSLLHKLYKINQYVGNRIILRKTANEINDNHINIVINDDCTCQIISNEIQFSESLNLSNLIQKLSKHYGIAVNNESQSDYQTIDELIQCNICPSFYILWRFLSQEKIPKFLESEVSQYIFKILDSIIYNPLKNYIYYLMMILSLDKIKPTTKVNKLESIIMDCSQETAQFIKETKMILNCDIPVTKTVHDFKIDSFISDFKARGKNISHFLYYSYLNYMVERIEKCPLYKYEIIYFYQSHPDILYRKTIQIEELRDTKLLLEQANSNLELITKKKILPKDLWSFISEQISAKDASYLRLIYSYYPHDMGIVLHANNEEIFDSQDFISKNEECRKYLIEKGISDSQIQEMNAIIASSDKKSIPIISLFLFIIHKINENYDDLVEYARMAIYLLNSNQITRIESKFLIYDEYIENLKNSLPIFKFLPIPIKKHTILKANRKFKAVTVNSTKNTIIYKTRSKFLYLDSNYSLNDLSFKYTGKGTIDIEQIHVFINDVKPSENFTRYKFERLSAYFNNDMKGNLTPPKFSLQLQNVTEISKLNVETRKITRPSSKPLFGNSGLTQEEEERSENQLAQSLISIQKPDVKEIVVGKQKEAALMNRNYLYVCEENGQILANFEKIHINLRSVMDICDTNFELRIKHDLYYPQVTIDNDIVKINHEKNCIILSINFNQFVYGHNSIKGNLTINQKVFPVLILCYKVAAAVYIRSPGNFFLNASIPIIRLSKGRFIHDIEVFDCNFVKIDHTVVGYFSDFDNNTMPSIDYDNLNKITRIHLKSDLGFYITIKIKEDFYSNFQIIVDNDATYENAFMFTKTEMNVCDASIIDRKQFNFDFGSQNTNLIYQAFIQYPSISK